MIEIVPLVDLAEKVNHEQISLIRYLNHVCERKYRFYYHCRPHISDNRRHVIQPFVILYLYKIHMDK